MPNPADYLPKNFLAHRAYHAGLLTKREYALGMLCRPEGATIAEIAAQLDCSANAARLHIAALRKDGVKVEVLARFHQFSPYVSSVTSIHKDAVEAEVLELIPPNPNRPGANGRYTVFHVALAAPGQ